MRIKKQAIFNLQVRRHDPAGYYIYLCLRSGQGDGEIFRIKIDSISYDEIKQFKTNYPDAFY